MNNWEKKETKRISEPLYDPTQHKQRKNFNRQQSFRMIAENTTSKKIKK